MEQQQAVTNETQAVITPFNFSEKSLDLLRTKSSFDICEGTARSSKTTTLAFKFGLHVNSSSHMQFFIAGATQGVARRNVVDEKNGFLALFRGCAREGTNTRYGSHLVFTDTLGREKIIYIFGFKDKARWQTVLGSTLGGGIIDEINIADVSFVNEVFRSLIAVDGFWLGATLNPDNPDKEIYTNYINKSIPLKKWEHDIPKPILEDLANADEKIKGAIYWHFNFNDNPIMTQNKVDLFKSLYPKDSFYYASKILGLRGVSEGVIFKMLDDSYLSKSSEYIYRAQKVIMDDIEYLFKTDAYTKYVFGVDLGGNQEKKGTRITFTGFHRQFQQLDVLGRKKLISEEAVALVVEICDFIEKWYKQVLTPIKIDAVYIDGYGAVNVLLPTIRKELVNRGINLKVRLAIKYGKNSTKTTDKATDADRHSRLMTLLLLFNLRRIRFINNSEGRELIRQLKTLVYNPKDNLPLDENQDAMDDYDSLCYTITPFITELNDNIMRDEERKRL